MQSPELVAHHNKVRLFWVFCVSLLVDTVLNVRASVKISHVGMAFCLHKMEHPPLGFSIDNAL